ncbi:MAG: hypothetical protein LBT66_06225 [Methanobrevibacter sp.]|jgi:hypothetical protein|nr:hypothetical protein [Candidatus Methanovirga meridionalis]
MNKFLTLSILLFAIIGCSSIATVSSGGVSTNGFPYYYFTGPVDNYTYTSPREMKFDADWRLCTFFRITDITTGETESIEVAGGDAHTITYDESHKFHTVQVDVTYRGSPHPSNHKVTIWAWDGSCMELYNRVSYNWGGYYNTHLQYRYKTWRGETDTSVTL